jgi:hypothetical protein
MMREVFDGGMERLRKLTALVCDFVMLGAADRHRQAAVSCVPVRVSCLCDVERCASCYSDCFWGVIGSDRRQTTNRKSCFQSDVSRGLRDRKDVSTTSLLKRTQNAKSWPMKAAY